MPFNVAACNSSGYNYASGRLDHQTYFKSIRVEQEHLACVVLDRALETRRLRRENDSLRRAVEERLLDPKRVVQLGIRGSIYDPDEHGWARDQGMRIFYMEEIVRRGVDAVRG